MVCLNIFTTASTPCQSSWCDTVYVNIPPPPDTCHAAFTYQASTTNTIVHLFDQSTSTNGTINSWFWTISQNNIPFDSSTLQNPVFNYPGAGFYNLCLQITTDSGCSAHYCHFSYLSDSNNIPCQLNVSSNINQVSVINGTDGSIDLTVTGGTPPYSYLWNTGATTQDIYNLSSGVYTVAISTVPACPNYTYSFYVGSPLDSLNAVIDTLYSSTIDTCLNFVIDSFYVSNISIQGNSVTVQWVFIGGGATATLNATYTFTYLGTQMVVLTVNCNGAKEIDIYTSYIYINQIYGINKNSDESQYYLYPNPASDFLNISFGNPGESTISLQIFSSTGQQVFSRSVAAHTSQIAINVSEFPSGVYFIRIDNGSGKPIVKKFLK